MTPYQFFMDEELIASLVVTLFSGIPSGIFGLVTYVLTSMALYTIAQRRQIKNAWLSWVPVLNCWILGSLSDQYRYVSKGQICSKRKWLLTLNIISIVLVILIIVVCVMMVVTLTVQGEHIQNILGHIISLMVLLVPIMAVAVASAIFRYMALYDVYMSLDPSNAVLFLILSILIGIVEPFFLFFNRDKDLGMPPRRRPAPQPEPEPIPVPEDKDFL